MTDLGQDEPEPGLGKGAALIVQLLTGALVLAITIIGRSLLGIS